MFQVVSAKNVLYRMDQMNLAFPSMGTLPPTITFSISVGYLDAGGGFVKTTTIGATAPPQMVGAIMSAVPAPGVSRAEDMNTTWLQWLIDAGVIEGVIESWPA